MRVGAIDIGTNTALLVIEDVDQSGARSRLVDACEFTRLGKGVDKTHRLADESIRRALEVLRSFREQLDRHGVGRFHAVATSASRDASNAADFIRPAQEILGQDLEIIAGEREAALIYRGNEQAFPDIDDLVIADVGGGSTEVIRRGPNGIDCRSLNIGAVRFHERFIASDPPAPQEMATLFAEIDNKLDEELVELGLGGASVLVGTAGTATTIASLHKKLKTYDAEAVHDVRLPVTSVQQLLAKLLERSVEERTEMVGLEPERADVIVAGVAIYVRLLEKLGAHTFITSERGVRAGLIEELLAP